MKINLDGNNTVKDIAVKTQVAQLIILSLIIAHYYMDLGTIGYLTLLFTATVQTVGAFFALCMLFALSFRTAEISSTIPTSVLRDQINNWGKLNRDKILSYVYSASLMILSYKLGWTYITVLTGSMLIISPIISYKLKNIANSWIDTRGK